MKAHVNKEACIGWGLCAEMCPEVFEMDSEDRAEVKGDTVPVDAEDTCSEAAVSCPVEAISIEK